MKKALWCAIAILLIGCTTATPVPPTQTPWIITATPARSVTVTPTVYFGADTISWNDARNFIGQTKTVCGNVVRTTYAENSAGQPTYLDVGRAYPDPARLSIVIWGNQRANFSTPPETMYRNKTICVNGTIRTYQGVVQIEVKTPAEIEIK